jgi:hypothetical protein
MDNTYCDPIFKFPKRVVYGLIVVEGSRVIVSNYRQTSRQKDITSYRLDW